MKNISIALALMFITPLSSLANDEEITQGKQYICTKEDKTVILEKLTSREATYSCYILINDPDPNASSVISSSVGAPCAIALGKQIVKYIDEGYACS